MKLMAPEQEIMKILEQQIPIFVRRPHKTGIGRITRLLKGKNAHKTPYRVVLACIY